MIERCSTCGTAIASHNGVYVGNDVDGFEVHMTPLAEFLHD